MRKISLHSRRKLKPADAPRFAHLEPDLFVDLAKVVCSVGMLPQKELHESWQMANCVHQEFPDILRVVDLAAGHGLLAWIFVLLARSGDSPMARTAVAVDIKRPKSADVLAAAMTHRWPDLAGTVHYVEGSIDAVRSEDGPRTLFVAAHACGSLSDRVLLTAMNHRSPVAIIPCCHSLRHQTKSLESLAIASGLETYTIDQVVLSIPKIGLPMSIDQVRTDALAALGYEVIEASIQPEITAFNRVIMGKPPLTRRHDVAMSQLPSTPIGSVKRLGEIRAYEKVRSFDVSNATEVQSLAVRPSCEWRRSFDLSYWVDDEETGLQLGRALAVLADVTCGTIQREVSICDRYVDDSAKKLAFTYRINLWSTTVRITKSDATTLRNMLCQDLGNLVPEQCFIPRSMATQDSSKDRMGKT